MQNVNVFTYEKMASLLVISTKQWRKYSGK